MPYWIKRILLTTGELVTERELRGDEHFHVGEAPVVGDFITVICRGRTFPARVVWGNWRDQDRLAAAGTICPLRVEEVQSWSVDGAPTDMEAGPVRFG